MTFLSTTAKLAGALGAALLMSTAIANAAPAERHDMGPRAERHDTRGAPAGPQFDGRKFARVERHGKTGHCDKAHRHQRHDRHAERNRHGEHRMAEMAKHRHRAPDRHGPDRHDGDHDRRG